jgi:hypothetical protein
MRRSRLGAVQQRDGWGLWRVDHAISAIGPSRNVDPAYPLTLSLAASSRVGSAKVHMDKEEAGPALNAAGN